MARGINKDVLIAEYASGDSLPVVAKRNNVSPSTVRLAAISAGVLRSRSDGFRRAVKEGRLGSGMRGKKRVFSAEHKAAIKRSAIERGKRLSAGKTIKPNGYVEYTTGEHKGKMEHRVVAEEMIGRPLEDDEVVHHKDRKRANNDPSNLEVMKRTEHSSLHRREKLKWQEV